MSRGERDESMLVLTRKVGQSIMIGDVIQVTLIEVRGEQARLGITAPVTVPVRRKELLDKLNGVEDSPTEGEAPQSEPKKPNTH